jgi:hypothetical protein
MIKPDLVIHAAAPVRWAGRDAIINCFAQPDVILTERE